MRQFTHELTVATRGRGLYDISAEVSAWASCQGVTTGLLTLFIAHTSASLVIQENADPDVLRDLEDFFSRLAPDGDAHFRHRQEGPDDMPAHVRSALTQTHLAIPVLKGRPALGVWQGIYLFEHRRHPHRRTVILHLSGE